VNSPAAQGLLTMDLPPHSSPDASNALAIDLTESQGQLASVSAADAANLVTLCYVDGELLAYQTAILTAANQYSLTNLYRGAYGTAIANHPSGTQFARLDGSVGRFAYPNSLIGQTVYLKFASMNIVGGGLQSLASLPAYTYTVKGSGQNSSIIVTGSFGGKPTANLVLQSYVFAASATVPAGVAGSRGTAATAATATTTFIIRKNSTNVGTMVFAAAAMTATFTMSSATAFSAGDVLTLVAPAAPDVTLANLAWTILGIS
ncbi:MAG: hypothetical protein JOY83_05280, partial [Alphaproteobacteria bacterium]|nr:hypothetical protein [Alphaproteobacteria bacterium]